MSFPTVTLLDSFVRTENPLGVTKTEWREFFESGTNKGWLNGSEWETLSGLTIEGAYWHPATYSEPGVALEFTFEDEYSPGNYWAVMACISNPEEIHFTGYRLKLTTLGKKEGASFKFKLEKAVLGVWTVLAETSESVVMDKEYRFGLSVQGGKVIGWRKIKAGAWEEIINHADSAYTSGYVGFNAIAQFGDIINFEAGPAEGGPPVITNPGTRHSVISKALTRQIKATNTTEYKITGLPEGLSYSEVTGLIEGTPTKLESTKVKVTAKGPEGEDEIEFEWIIEEASGSKENVTYMLL
jgi:hypothetical protein